MSDRKNGRGGNGGRRSRIDQDDRRPRNAPYDRSDRGETRAMCRGYALIAGEFVEAQSREAEELREDMRQQQRIRRLREDLRSLHVELDGTETEDQLEQLLQDHNDRYVKLQAVGIHPMNLLDNRDVQHQWQRYQDALRDARLWDVPHDDNTAIQDLWRLVREKRADAGIHV